MFVEYETEQALEYQTVFIYLNNILFTHWIL